MKVTLHPDRYWNSRMGQPALSLTFTDNGIIYHVSQFGLLCLYSDIVGALIFGEKYGKSLSD